MVTFLYFITCIYFRLKKSQTFLYNKTMEESLNMVIDILGTAVLAAIVSSLFSYFISKKDDRLKYIVEERKVWRDKLREIVDNLNEIQYSGDGDDVKLYKTKQTIAELECRINPQGLTSDDIILDSHIWQKLNEIYKTEVYKEVDTTILRRYISSLLKYDWERAKVEVKGKGNVIPKLRKIIRLLSKREWDKAKAEVKGNSTPIFEGYQNLVEKIKESTSQE